MIRGSGCIKFELYEKAQRHYPGGNQFGTPESSGEVSLSFSISTHDFSFSKFNFFTLYNALNIREHSNPLTMGRYVLSSAS